jgi:hypothetical protein
MGSARSRAVAQQLVGTHGPRRADVSTHVTAHQTTGAVLVRVAHTTASTAWATKPGASSGI